MEIKLGKGAQHPTRANPTDAGLDLYAADWAYLEPHESKFVPINVAFKIPEGYVGLMFARSSLGKSNVTLANSVGVIDAHYRGYVGAYVTNHSEEVYGIAKGDRFCQMVLVPITTPELEVFEGTEEDWVDTKRGIGGFGSTGQ